MASTFRDPSRPLDVAALWFVDRIELSRGTAGHNVRPMEGLRGFAVFLVFLVHYATLIEPHLTGASVEVASALRVIGNRGVDLFFVLSGYLIYGSLMARPQPFGRFMARRAQRIYPAFLVVFAIYLLLGAVHLSEHPMPKAPLDAALYVVANLLLLPGLFPIEAYITVAWSLSYEMFYYLAIPLIVTGLALRSRGVVTRVVLFSAFAVALAAYCFFQAGPVRLVMFVAGILLYETIQARRIEPPSVAVVVASLVVAFAATLVPTLGSTGYMWKTMLLFVAFWALCFTCFERPRSSIARAVSVTPLRWLGNMSYSYYLLHGLALKVAFVVADRVWPDWSGGALPFFGLMPLFFGITLIPTLGLYLFVEYPLSLSPKRPLHAPNAVEAEAKAVAR